MVDWLISIGKKHGITGFLIVWLFWTNQRLTRVETELYKCYDNAVYVKNSHSSLFLERFLNYAILTKEEKYVDEEMEGKNA